MGQEEKIRLIAEFMGATIDEDLNVKFILPADGIGLAGCGLHACKYHSSWDWQVPAWSKIAHLTQSIASESEEKAKQHLRFADMYECAVFTNNPLEGFKIIVEAITFYNSNKL